MKRINGRDVIERDEVGEFPRVNKERMIAACNRFLISRGINPNREFQSNFDYRALNKRRSRP